MGRTTPNNAPLLPLPLPLPLLAFFVGIASTIAILAALCASHHRKSSTPKSHPQSPSSPSTDTAETSPPTPATSPPSTEEKDGGVVIDVATHGPIGPTAVAAPPAPRRKLSVSLSMKLRPEGLSRIRTGKVRERQEQEQQQQPVAAEEESVWMKTIILGERCKVPSEDEEEEETAAGAGIYDEKGNRQRNYHPKTPRSLPVSRTNSFANVEVVSPVM